MAFKSHDKLITVTATIVLVGFFSASFAGDSLGGESCDTPIVFNVKIQPAPKGTPSKHVAFLGAWGNGKWDGNVCNTLIVEEISPGGNVTLVYSWGNYGGWNVRQGSTRTDGKFNDDNELRFTFRGGKRVVTYWLEGDHLKGTYERTYTGYDGSPQTYTNYTTLKRIPNPSASVKGPTLKGFGRLDCTLEQLIKSECE